MHPQTAKGALTNGRNTFRSKELMQASLFTRLNGALDEWLSQRSAKPSTAVRIRQAPHYKVLRPRQTKGFQDFSFQKYKGFIHQRFLFLKWLCVQKIIWTQAYFFVKILYLCSLKVQYDSTMKLPKFIITMDGTFRLGMVDQHKHLLKPGDQCIGGGYYTFDFVSNRIILDSQVASGGYVESPLYLSWPSHRL